MKKLMMAVCAAVAVQMAGAEEFGAGNAAAEVALPQNGEAIAADQAVLEAETALDVKKTATQQLRDFVREFNEEAAKNKSARIALNRYDGKSKQLVVDVHKKFTIPSQDVSTKYLELRRAEMSWLLLAAKGKLVRTIRGGELTAGRSSTGTGEMDALVEDAVRGAEGNFVGCTVVGQFESCIQDGDIFRCEIAILYSWSEENEALAKAIQTAFKNPKLPSVKLAPRKRSVEDWLARQAEKGALGEWLGPRRYVDNEGEVWFLGISAMPCDSNVERQEDNEERARMLAEAEVAWALFSDVSMNNALKNETLISKLKAFDSLTTAEKAQLKSELDKYMAENSTIETAGMTLPYEGEVRDASGQKIYVAVAAMSLQSKRDVLGLMRKSEDTRREIESARGSEKNARINKIGNPKAAQGGTVGGGRGDSGKSDAGRQSKGRLGLGVRHYSEEDDD